MWPVCKKEYWLRVKVVKWPPLFDLKSKGRGGHLATFTGPMLFCAYRPHLLIYFDEMLYGSLY